MHTAKIAIGQIQIQPEDFCHQGQQIRQIIQAGKAQQVDCLIFPAFSTTGYLPKDAILFPDFYRDCQDLDQEIATLSENITIIWGSITYEQGQVIPTIFLARNHKIIFSTTPSPQTKHYDFTMGDNTTSLAFSWETPQNTTSTRDNSPQLELVFYENPVQELTADEKTTAETVTVPTLYLHNTGLSYEDKQIYVLPGTYFALPQNSKRYALPQGATGLFTLEEFRANPITQEETIATICQRTIYGIRAFLESSNLKKVVVGLSGGIDSALGACLYQQAIGTENMLLVNMPSRYNSHLTQNLAKKLSEKLGCYYGVFPIEDSVNMTISQLENTPLIRQEETLPLQVSGFTGENIQARDRGSRILAAIAQSVSGVFTANCNKTEIAVGYATMYGDQAGFLAATGNLWKHEVYALARYMDKEIYQEPILADIINLKPSAELSPQQDITKGLGDPLIYDYHDRLLAAWEDSKKPLALEEILSLYMEKKLGKAIGCPQEVIDDYFPTAEGFINDLERWWRAYSGMANVKRFQSPPILIVHNPPKSLHLHRLHNPYFSPEYLKRKAELIKA